MLPMLMMGPSQLLIPPPITFHPPTVSNQVVGSRIKVVLPDTVAVSPNAEYAYEIDDADDKVSVVDIRPQ